MFTVSDNNTGRTKGSVQYFGLDNIIEEASNAQFVINGMEKESRGNIFTVEKQYEIEIFRESQGEEDVAHVELKEDMESMASNIEELIGGYNAFIDTANAYSEHHPKSGRLVREMYELASMHVDEFESLGIELKDDSHIVLDKEKLYESSAEGDISEKLEGLKKFAGSMLRKANQVSLNPMHYADRTVVAYKNPGHNFVTPYVTSAYTGMMFNSYC